MPWLFLALIAAAPPSEAALIRTANDFLGPYVALPDGRIVNASAHYWDTTVGVPFTRDAELVIPPTPLDLNLDRTVDTTFEGRWRLTGGLLANPELTGLIPTPDDPRGTVGRWSVSTGYLGVREEKDPVTGQGTGRYGFNCWYCHAGTGPGGDIVLGLPNANIHLGLIMASSRALDPDYVIADPLTGQPVTPRELVRREALDDSFRFDLDGDGRVTTREWRTTLRLPTAEETRALLMLAGPGRMDQSVDYRMDGTIPLANLQHYMLESQGRDEYLRSARKLKRAVFNPVSIPQNLTGLGAAHYSWTGKESSMRHDAVALAAQHMKTTPDALARLLDIPFAGEHVDYEVLSRLLTLDFRNVGTAGRETDYPPGNGWAHEVMTAASESVMTRLPREYGAVELRQILTRERAAAPPDPARVALIERGRRVFTEAIVGEVINQRVLHGREARSPENYRGIAVLAPLDRSRPIDAKVPVRCATCHNHSPLATLVPVSTPLAPLQRCDLCHLDHRDRADWETYYPLADYMVRENLRTVNECLACHPKHPDFGPQAYTNSWLLPFDADGDGATFGDEAEDAGAGGIGTDAYLNVDSLFTVQLRPPQARPDKMYLVARDAKRVPRKTVFSRAGYGWVRVAPLVGVGRSAPYLHNGSVPSLEALLADPAERPARFQVGLPAQRAVYDTTLPGNGRGGHRFGTALSEEDKDALKAFLMSIP